jgi:hypothetical protein
MLRRVDAHILFRWMSSLGSGGSAIELSDRGLVWVGIRYSFRRREMAEGAKKRPFRRATSFVSNSSWVTSGRTSSGRNIGRATALKLAGKGFKSLSMMRARTRLSIGAGPHVFYEAQRCRPIAVIAGDNDGDEFAVPMLCQGSQENPQSPALGFDIGFRRNSLSSTCKSRRSGMMNTWFGLSSNRSVVKFNRGAPAEPPTQTTGKSLATRPAFIDDWCAAATACQMLP